MPASPKDPSVRARRNKTTTRAVLKAQTNPSIPPLPDHIEWYQIVEDWWTRCWSSPMVPEWTDSDRDALYLAAGLMQEFWDPETSSSAKPKIAGEVRQLLAQCGLTPMSRRSLQWEIERAEAAQESTNRRRSGRSAAKKAPAKAADPREARRNGLHAV